MRILKTAAVGFLMILSGSCLQAQRSTAHVKEETTVRQPSRPVMVALERAFRAGDYAKARAIADQEAASADDPGLAAFYHSIASAMAFAQGDVEASTVSLRAAFNNGHLDLAVTNAASLALEIKNDGWYQEFRKVALRNLDALSTSAVVRFGESDINYSIETQGWKKASGLVSEMTNLGNAWLTKGLKNATAQMWSTGRYPTSNPAETLQIMDLMISLFPDIQQSSSYRYNRGTMLNMQGKSKEALEEYLAAQKLAAEIPDKANACYGLMTTYKELGEKQKAAASARELLRFSAGGGDLAHLRQQAFFVLEYTGEPREGK